MRTRHGFSGLRMLTTVPPPSSSLLDGRVRIMHGVLLRFERRALDHISALSRPTRLDIQDLMTSWRAVKETPHTTESGRMNTAAIFNSISEEYNELERRVDRAIAAAGTSDTGGGSSAAEEAGRRGAEAIATGTAQGIGRIVLIAGLAAGGLAVLFLMRRRNGFGALPSWAEKREINFTMRLKTALPRRRPKLRKHGPNFWQDEKTGELFLTDPNTGKPFPSDLRKGKLDCLEALQVKDEWMWWLDDNAHWMDRRDLDRQVQSLNRFGRKYTDRCSN